jgi:chorismate mutase
MEAEMCIRGVRGATVADENHAESILAATRELLLAILKAHPSMRPEELASILFTVTEDLDDAYPAQAARQIGWSHTPLICAREIPVPGGIPRCIRVLIHWNTELPQREVRHVYLKDAARLRPDWAAPETAIAVHSGGEL